MTFVRLMVLAGLLLPLHVHAATRKAHHGGAPVILTQLQAASLCGSAGCSTSVYLRRDHEWTKVLDSVSGPIRVMPQSNDGMHDLLVGRNDRWTWSGGGYRDTLAAPPLTGLKRSVEQHRAAFRRHQDPTTN